jgi:hypothetical protein
MRRPSDDKPMMQARIFVAMASEMSGLPGETM